MYFYINVLIRVSSIFFAHIIVIDEHKNAFDDNG